MPAHSIASRRQRRKSRPPTPATRAPKRAPAAAPTPKRSHHKKAPAPQPPYPPDTERIARAAQIILRTPAAGPARYALFCLALLAEDDLTVSLPQADLGALLGTSIRNVRRIMASLRQLGALVMTQANHGPGRPAVYRIVPAHS